MAISAPVKTSDFSGFLTPEMAEPIFEQAARLSAVQQLARRIPMGPTGRAIPVVTGKATANWVAEGGQKPASNSSMELKTMVGHKLAAISVVSAEVIRVNPGQFVEQTQNHLAESFALAFDRAALYGLDMNGSTGPFATYLGQTSYSVTLGTATQQSGGVWADLNEALRTLVNSGSRLTGWLLDARIEPELNAAVDTTGRPIFVLPPHVDTAAPVRQATLMGRPAMIADTVGEEIPTTPATPYGLGFAGDWSQVVWGVVGGITYDVSTEATVTINGQLVSLWEHNLVAIRAEAEYGFLVNDPDAFVQINGQTAAEAEA